MSIAGRVGADCAASTIVAWICLSSGVNIDRIKGDGDVMGWFSCKLGCFIQTHTKAIVAWLMLAAPI
jgi:hypothetical protein